MLQLEDIVSIGKTETIGYGITFSDGRSILLSKKRTIIAVLVLIHKGEGSEDDIAQGNSTIGEIRNALGERLPDGIVQDFYRDANKPFSELWNEEGFTFIDNLKGGRVGKSQKYTLDPESHELFFRRINKANRKAPSSADQKRIKINQGKKCNLCGSLIFPKSELKKNTYAKDRRREVFDHRHPVEKGGTSDFENYQALCFYCNKSKWQICNICTLPNCSPDCALNKPESSNIIKPTGEDIGDLIRKNSP